MSRPWKHPKTGIYWFRKRVPDDVRAVIGKLEEKRSLNTRDLAEAKLRHLEMLSEVENRWRTLRQGPRVLTERDCHELAAPPHQKWLANYGENPSEQTFWLTDLYNRLWTPAVEWDTSASLQDNLLAGLDAETLHGRDMEAWCQHTADNCLSGQGLLVDGVSRKRMARAIAVAAQRASLALERLARGEFGDQPAPFASPSTGLAVARGSSAREASIKLLDLFRDWAAERQPAAKTT